MTTIFVDAKPALGRDNFGARPNLPKIHCAGTDLEILRKLLVGNATSNLKIAVKEEDVLGNFWGIHVGFPGGIMNESALK